MSRNKRGNRQNQQAVKVTQHVNRKGKRTKQGVVEDRWEKKAETGKVVKEKFQEENTRKVKPIQAKNTAQKKYISSLDSNMITVGYGASGTGKTYVACYHAATLLLKGEIEKIVLIRPYEQVGKSIGMRPGDSEDKLTPLMQSMLDPLIEVLGVGMYEYCLAKGKIVMEAMEDIRGRSYKEAFVIVDEIQSACIQTVKTLVTRLGDNSQLVLCGDGTDWQVDIKGKSGLTWFVNTIDKLREHEVDYLDEYDEWELHNNIGIVQFTSEDIVRSGITKLFVKVFDEEV